jgi:hypothetical protein
LILQLKRLKGWKEVWTLWILLFARKTRRAAVVLSTCWLSLWDVRYRPPRLAST